MLRLVKGNHQDKILVMKQKRVCFWLFALQLIVFILRGQSNENLKYILFFIVDDMVC